MSGHNKWSTIKHKKAATDAKRGAAFTKIIRELTVAAKAGGGDPNSNPRLRVAISAAKEANMPKDTLERAIKKGTGELEGATYEDVTYEGYGPGGVAVYVEASTDNKNRTAAEIRHIFAKYNGNMGEVGCVGWMFKKKGEIIVPAEGVDEDALMEIALEAGAEDMERDGDEFVVTTEWQNMLTVRETIEAKGIAVESGTVSMIPDNTVQIEGKPAETLMKLLGSLDDFDDVNSVAANYQIDDSEMERIMNA
ncbi:MAG TPA: YebC/PmpR family DNA-binding transcriptional regulator [Candidatus Sumerlaeota bacterium]|nr:YebC/PmpR family DNA-binding transcriptional regulator [Candidatus Sumerlaeota bacterium]HPS01253.1 YebC/PmpR family DNA-binding transcriptional regulator [Candidatus Sumerlaeota bacterium]